jgi:hypothetical protein
VIASLLVGQGSLGFAFALSGSGTLGFAFAASGRR